VLLPKGLPSTSGTRHNNDTARLSPRVASVSVTSHCISETLSHRVGCRGASNREPLGVARNMQHTTSGLRATHGEYRGDLQPYPLCMQVCTGMYVVCTYVHPLVCTNVHTGPKLKSKALGV
jgi:hypothetical protein